jgi:O-antigen ligase
MIAVLFILVTLSMLFLSSTRRRIIVLCAFYFSFGLLTVINDDSVFLLGGLKLYRIAYPFLFLSVLVRILREPEFFAFVRRWPILPYLGLVFITLISSLHSLYIDVFSFNDPASLFGVLIVMSLYWISASQIQGPDDPLIFGGTAAALSLAISVWVIWTASRADFSAFRGGTNVNENYESLYVLAGVFPIIGLLFHVKSKVWRLFLILALLPIALGASILASRGMILAGLVGILAMSAGYAKKLKLSRVILLSAILVGVFAAATILPGGGNIVDVFQAPEVATLDDRTFIWGASMQRFMNAGILEILFGNGLSASLNLVPDYGNYHNVFLQWLMEQGVVGLTLFLVFLSRTWGLVSRSDSSSRETMVGWFVFLLGAGLSSTISNEHCFWIIVGILAGAGAISKPAEEYARKKVDVPLQPATS